MVKKIIKIIALVLFGLLFFGSTVECLANAATQFKQAETYKKNKQYDQAEQIYQQILINFPDSNDALEAQKQLTCLYIVTDSQQQADAAFAELTASFAGHKEIAEAIWRVGRVYMKTKKFNKAEEAHQYNVGHFPADVYAMWSQVEIFHSHVRKGDNAAADAAVDKLLSVFASQPTLPNKIQQVGEEYAKAKRRDKALEMWNYNVENYPKDKYAMWSQVEIVKFYIGDGNDAAAADAAVDKLLSVFASQPTLPRGIHQIANKYSKARRCEKAMELCKYNVARFPKDKYAMLSQVEIVCSYIRDPNVEETVVDAAVDKLLSVFASQPTLPKVIRKIANRYNKAGKFEKGMELRKYNVARFPKYKYAMWSQVEIISAHINDANDTAADAAVQKLLGLFSDNPKLLKAKAIRGVAKKYNASGRSDKAMELWMRNVDNSPNNVNAMLSQMDIIYSYIDPNDGDDAAVDAAVDKLLTVFADQPTLPQKIHYIANRYRNIGKYERAIQFYQLAAERWPEGKIAITSRVAIGQVHIERGDDKAVQTIIDGLIADYNDHPDLPKAIFQIGEEYYNKAFRYEKEGLDTEARDSFTKAITVWEKIITELPQSSITPQAYNFAGDCYRRLSQYEKAIAYYQKVVNNWPDYEYAWNAQFLIGRTYENLKESGAISKSQADPKIQVAYKRLLEKHPDCVAAEIARRWLTHNK